MAFPARLKLAATWFATPEVGLDIATPGVVLKRFALGADCGAPALLLKCALACVAFMKLGSRAFRP
uniref:Uncharacterized protein n=1 Tax=Arundo donax TaxID=35708 RepID=A0A0A9D150_ARUDO